MSLLNLTALDLVTKMKKGEISSEKLVKNYIDQIKTKDKEVEAWEFFDEELAISQAKKLDADRQAGKIQGDLHGIPVGIKDIFDTEDNKTRINKYEQVKEDLDTRKAKRELIKKLKKNNTDNT